MNAYKIKNTIKQVVFAAIVLLGISGSALAQAKADYTYTADDMVSNGPTVIEQTIVIADVATIGTITVGFNWTNGNIMSHGKFYLISPLGTEVLLWSAGSTGYNEKVFDDFNNEQLNGTWTFKITDFMGGGGHTATNIKMEVNVLPTEPKFTIDTTNWDAGEIQVGYSYSANSFTIANAGIDTIRINSVTDLSATNFSASLVPADVALGFGQSYDFNFEYTPSGIATDNQDFTISLYSDDATISLDTTITLKGEGIRVADANFETGELPYGWKVIDNDGNLISWEIYKPNTQFASEYFPHSGSWVMRSGYNANAADDWLILPKMRPYSGNNKIFFWASSISETINEEFKVMLSTTGSDINDFTVQLSEANLAATKGWLKYSFDLSAYTDQDIYVAIVHTAKNKVRLYIDDLYAPILNSDSDIGIFDYSGPVAPNKDSTSIFSVSVRNFGILDQDTYAVEFYSTASGLIDSKGGTTISQGEQADFDFEYTPTTTGVHELFFKAVLNDDALTENNISDNFKIYVQPATTDSITVGNGNFESRLFPLYYTGKNSVSQSIYFADELNEGGYLNGVDYFNKFDVGLSNKHIKIWAGETENISLSTDWLATDNFVKVFDGEISLKEGENEVHVQFDTTFLYHGKNLVLMVERVFDTLTYSFDNYFYTTETLNHPSRSRVYASQFNLDPHNMASSVGIVKNEMPNTRFYFNDEGLGFVKGYVYDENSEAIAGANVTLLGSDLSAKTDEDGYYEFSYIPVGAYEITAEYFAYNMATATVDVTNGGTSIHDFNLTMRPKISVKGTLVKSDALTTGLSNAEIYLKGYANYDTISISNGSFEFKQVWGNTSYTMTILAYGCDPYVQELLLNDVNVNLDTLVINETAYAVSNVEAVVNSGGNANVSWTPVNGGSKSFVGYSVYRLEYEQRDSISNWTTIIENFTGTSLTDTYFRDLGAGHYLYAVVANYTNGLTSDVVFSNSIGIDMEVGLNVTVSTNSGDEPNGAEVTLENVSGDKDHVYSFVTESNGVASFNKVWRGTYILSVTLPGFGTYTDSALVVDTDGKNISIELIELLLAPIDLNIDFSAEHTRFSWSNVQLSNSKAVHKYYVYLTDTVTPVDTVSTMHYDFENLTETESYTVGVKAVYAAGVSPIALHTFIVPDFSSLHIAFSTNSGDLANNTNYKLELDTTIYPYVYIIDNANTDTVVFNKLVKGDYILSVSQKGFYTYTDSAFVISEESDTINVQLIERLDAPIDLYVDHSVDSTVLHWSAGQTQKRFSEFLIFINDTIAIDSTTSTHINISNLITEGETYNIGVAAKYSTGISDTIFVNTKIPQLNIVTVNVSTNNGSPTGAYIKIRSNSDSYYKRCSEDGTVIFKNVLNGTYKLSVSLPDFEDHITDITVLNDTLIDVELNEFIVQAYNLNINLSGTEALLTWNHGEYLFKDSFEDSVLNENWELIKGSGVSNGSNPANWFISDINAYDGSQAIACDWGTDISTWLISPDIFIKESDIVSFAWNSSYYWSVLPNDNSDLFVKVSTDGGLTWEYIWTYGEIGVWANNTWYETVLSLADYAGKTVKIAFHLEGSDNSPNLLDDIFIGPGSGQQGSRQKGEYVPTGMADKSIPAGKKSGKSIKAVQSYKVFLNDLTNPVLTTTETSHTFTGLDYNTTYTAGVMSVFETGESGMSTIEFTTKPETRLVNFNVDMTDAVGFDPITDTIYITGTFSQWAVPGTDNLVIMTDSDNDRIYTIELDIPLGNLEYKYFKNAGWDNGEPISNNRTATVSDVVTFNDTWGQIVSINIDNNNEISIYPNPAYDMVNISGLSNSEVLIYSVTGNLMLAKANQSGNSIIDLSNYPNGIYLIKIVNINGIITKKLTIE